MRRFLIGIIPVLLLGIFAVVFIPSVREPLQVLWYHFDHMPHDAFYGPTELLGEPPEDAYRGKISDLRFLSWVNENGQYQYRFVNMGSEPIYAHSSFFQKYLGLRHLELGPGQAAHFCVYIGGPTAVGDEYTISLASECSTFAFSLESASMWLTIPVGNFQ